MTDIWINATTSTGALLNYFTTNNTGDLFITLLVVLALFLTMALMFKIPLEYTLPLVLPLLMVYMSYSGQFLAIGGIALIYMAIIFTKMFWING